MEDERRFQARKIARLRREVAALRVATDAKAAAIARNEASEYRKALSNILYRLDQGGVDDLTLRSICEGALTLRGLKPWARKRALSRAVASDD